MIRDCKWAVVIMCAILLTVASGALLWLFAEGTLNEFVRNVILVLAGIPIALQVDHWVEQRKSREKRRQLLHALKDTLVRNLELIDKAVAAMQDDVSRLPMHPLDLITLDASASVRYELLNDLSLAALIDRAHFGLRNFENRIAILHARFETAGFPADRQDVQRLATALAAHRETQRLSKKTHARLDKPAMNIRLSDINCAVWKRDAIEVAVGLTPFDPDEQPPRLHLESGAYGLCNAAIAAIEKVLAAPSG